MTGAELLLLLICSLKNERYGVESWARLNRFFALSSLNFGGNPCVHLARGTGTQL